MRDDENKSLVGFFNPFEKLLVKLGIFPQIGVKIKKYFKPPARSGLQVPVADLG